MNKITALLIAAMLYSPLAHASFGEELVKLPVNVVLLVTTSIKVTDLGCHFLWDTVHGKLIHPLANALAETAEVVTFNTVDLNGNGD